MIHGGMLLHEVFCEAQNLVLVWALAMRTCLIPVAPVPWALVFSCCTHPAYVGVSEVGGRGSRISDS